MSKIIFSLVLLFSFTTFAASDFRSLTSGDLKELANLTAQNLNTCPREHLSIAQIRNMTSESVDVQAFKKFLMDSFTHEKLNLAEDGRIKIDFKVSSHIKEVPRSSFEVTYNLNSTFKDGEKIVCEINVDLMKSSLSK